MFNEEHPWHLGTALKMWPRIRVVSFYFPQTSAFLSSFFFFFLIPIVGMGTIPPLLHGVYKCRHEAEVWVGSSETRHAVGFI